MSRNHKDKYENSNPRRTHTFMSTEDANSGKKSYWPELEITGSIRNLSPNLWQLTHLTALYLNDNSLQRIPSEIGRLINLRALDLSSNKLRSLPAELGDLIYLRELLLNQNYLRVLPYELGKLFQLQVLGLQGNPLSKEIMALYGEPSGTHKLLSYMLDNLQGALGCASGYVRECSVKRGGIAKRTRREGVLLSIVFHNFCQLPDCLKGLGYNFPWCCRGIRCVEDFVDSPPLVGEVESRETLVTNK
ncbi:CCR4-NOT transcription complex subunit 6-like [Melipona quadrifasciata]|uniref:CCR4-NOT transcription complex subunit 6-like n=1 Tax=Melipona quadrifasciata TaxID=166423 RepID=A0A0M9A558_9HYME|nr:CCR4-NOT transcription complex subunit 6-like [Melipona quadrifasciata]